MADRLQVRHRLHLLHDKEGRIGQDEGVSRDVVAMPVEACLPAGDLGCELIHDNIHTVGFKARASQVLNVGEGLSADFPNGCCHHQRQQALSEEEHAPTEGGVGEKDEGRQQQQSPTPGQFDKVPSGEMRHTHKDS